jgi:hypothetical protein
MMDDTPSAEPGGVEIAAGRLHFISPVLAATFCPWLLSLLTFLLPLLNVATPPVTPAIAGSAAAILASPGS